MGINANFRIFAQILYLMKQSFKKIALVLFGALALSSCNLDQNDNYTFSYALTYSVKGEEQQKALTDFFKSKLDFDKTYSFSGSYYDATVFGCDKFKEDIKAFTNKEVLALLGKDDIAYLALNMFSSKGNMGAVGAVGWSHELDEEGEKPKE